MKLRSQLILMIGALVAVVISLMAGSLYYVTSFHFKDYVQQVELSRLSELKEALEQHYSEHGSLDNFKNRQTWREFLFTRFLRQDPEVRERPPQEPGERRRGRHLRDVFRRVVLLDQNQNLLVGPPGRNLSYDPAKMEVLIVKEKPIGWLGLHFQEPLETPLEQRFLEEQLASLSWIAAGSLGLACLVALWIARQVSVPISRLTQATQAIGKRQFEPVEEENRRDELGELIRHFNRMTEQLKRYELRQNQWLSDISHELRTPLAVLKGEIEALQDGIRPVTPESLASLHQEISRIIRLVEDLHQLSLSESGQLKPDIQRLDVLTHLKSTLNSFAPRFEQVSLSVKVEVPDPPLFLLADADRLHQVFVNLLENSIRHSRAPAQLQIQVQSFGGEIRLRFNDSPPGVRSDQLQRLTDRLFRGDSSRTRHASASKRLGSPPASARESSGSGLGLAISKNLVELMGGSLKLDHSPLGGLSVELTFDAAYD